MDVLSDVMKLMKFQGVLYFHTRFTGTWGIRVPAHPGVARFHMATQGPCWVRVDGADEPVLMNPGDMVVIPHGAAHILSDGPQSPVTHLDDVLRETGYGGAGELAFGTQELERETRLVCGHFEFGNEVRHPVLLQLPACIHIKRDDAIAHLWLDDAMKYLAFEATAERPGAGAMAQRLAEVLFIHVVRIWRDLEAARDSGGAGFMAALIDRNLARSLEAFHAAPGEDWSVDRLARESGASRTAFIQRFRAATGMTPMGYVTEWRMSLAARILTESALPIEQIAADLGYNSVAAFSRAFKKIMGANPGAHRRREISRV